MRRATCSSGGTAGKEVSWWRISVDACGAHVLSLRLFEGRQTNTWLWVSFRTNVPYPAAISFNTFGILSPGNRRPSWSPSRTGRLHAVLPPNRSISVSYTHLRAHETDSYLVCR